MTDLQLARMLQESRRALRTAAPREPFDLRARQVAESNRTMVPLVEAILAERAA